ncbi:MAG: formate--tetrahydrofolate ligase, partial [Bacteroidales bacterium]|nr:formate--tetrahydrofolate ligase [Bacteroidales bacterium]
TPASEVMAMLCLTDSYQELGQRLARTVVGFTYKGNPVRVSDIHAEGAMQVLLRDAIHPNLVQTLENTPALVHGGPFANIAQGTNTSIATRMALKLANYVVTEAGFATDLGAEKFFHIKCRSAGIFPKAVVIVVTVKAINYHGGMNDSGGFGNLNKHIENIRAFGINPVVSINRFGDDSEEDLNKIVAHCNTQHVEAVISDNFRKGGAGAVDLAKAVISNVQASQDSKAKYLYALDQTLEHKIETLAIRLYGADGVDYEQKALTDLELLNRHGYENFPVCVAKTPKSLSDNPKLTGRPRNFRITVNELRLSAGAGFVVVICGNIMTMPGLPKVPAATRIKVLPDGSVTGLA